MLTEFTALLPLFHLVEMGLHGGGKWVPGWWKRGYHVVEKGLLGGGKGVPGR
jgi:hypothetical protein